LPSLAAILKASQSGAAQALPRAEKAMRRTAFLSAVQDGYTWRTVALGVLGLSPMGVFSTLLLLQLLGVVTR
jgi:hypothetical protein